MTAAFILSELQSVGTPEKAVHLSRFFKTSPGQYGEGDQFLGVVVPQTRSIAKANKATPFDELQLLLDSPWHEARPMCLADFGLSFPGSESDAGRAGSHLPILSEEYAALQ